MPRLVLGAICLACVACQGGGGAPDPAALLEALGRHPDRLPPADADATTVMVTMGIDDRQVHIDGAPIPVLNTLRFERAMAKKLRHPPEHWVLQTRQAGRSYHYWTPIDLTPEVRVNLPLDDADGSHAGGLRKIPETYVMVRVPFHPEGRLDFYHADGRVAGRFRFGGEPSAPIVRADP